jgi:hypothetical protein
MRRAGIVVAFDGNLSDEEEEAVTAAIGRIRGVASVAPVDGDRLAERVGAMRERAEITDRVIAALRS